MRLIIIMTVGLGVYLFNDWISKKAASKKPAIDIDSGDKVLNQYWHKKMLCILSFALLIFFIYLPFAGAVPRNKTEWLIYICALGILGIVSVFLYIFEFRYKVYFNDYNLRIVSLWPNKHFISFVWNDIKSMTYRSLLDGYMIKFYTGKSIWIGDSMVGLNELLEQIRKNRPDIEIKQ